jgi:indole-3-glycerol phosphate synthase
VTEGFLDTILREVRSDIRRADYLRGLPPRPSSGRRPGLKAAIERERARGALLVEYKRISPGQAEPILPRRSPKEFLRVTDVDGVAGYSCLATRPRFDGAPEDVREIVRRTDRPVLFKEFVVDPVQLEAAARAGASAVLLIARLETDGRRDAPLAALARGAHDRGLEVLLEFHAPPELSRAEDVAADVYGVNARDLDRLSLDRTTADATLSAARERGLRPLLGLSGVQSPPDAARLWAAGADGLLVGTAVARAAEPAAFLAGLRRGAGGPP